jgi:glycosyltransferase involved in cell wall biosynthesis
MMRVLVISFVEWAGAFQRPHHLAVGIARRGFSVTYACPSYLHRRGVRIASGVELPASLSIVEAPALPGAGRLAGLARLNARLMLHTLRRVTSAPWDLIIFNDPRAAGVARELPARMRVFDCMDDLAAMLPSPKFARTVEAESLAAADRVWTGTYSLAERLAGRHAHVRFIPCGVDAAHFGRAAQAPAQDAQIAGELPPGAGPLAGYFGVMNERVDADYLYALLAAGFRVLLIGPATSRAPRLPEDERLRWIGPRPYAALPQYLAHFDLALIPYDNHGPHRFLYPVKALEYLAAGKPVLSTPLPDLQRFLSEYLALAETPEQWTAVARAFAEDPTPMRERAERGRAYAAARGWDAMLDEMQADLHRGAATGPAANGPGA